MSDSEILKIAEYFKSYSKHVWNRIRFARAAGFRISETTITENLMSDFYCAAQTDGTPVKIYEAKAP